MEQIKAKDFYVKQILQEYAQIAFSDISDYLVADTNGETRIMSLKELRNKNTSSIKEISYIKGKEKIKLHDKKPALDILAHYFIFNNKSENLSYEELQGRVMELLSELGINKSSKEIKGA